MSILGEHPQSISEKSLNYLLGLIKVEESTMTKLSALSIIHQLMMNEPNNDVKAIFLQNGILEWILLDFDVGFDSEENSVFLDVALNILWNISKLPVCLVQPMISQIIIRRLISMFDETTPFYSFPAKFKATLKLLCENKLLVGNVSSNLVSVKVKDDIRTATNGKLKFFKRFPEEIQMCFLYDTNDLDNEVNITNHLISNNLAWPLKQKDDYDSTSADDNEDAWKDVLVTEVIDGPYFWAHVGIDTIENVRRIQNVLLIEHSAGRLNPISCDKEDLVVVAKEVDEQICFFRAHIMSHKPQEVKVWALDYGFILGVMPDRVYKMPSSLDLPSQIQLCCIKGVQPQPRDPVLVRLAASILCNLTHKAISAGDIIVKLDGYEQFNRFLKISQDQKINKEVLKLITNLSFGEQKRKKWLETEIIPTLLDKLSDPGNKKIYANILFCLSNLIMKDDEARAKFYHNQGIDRVLTVIMQSSKNGTVYMACIHLLRSFVHRITMETSDKPMAPTKFQKAPTKNLTNYPVEMNKLITILKDTDLQMGEIQCSISEDRLGHSCDDEEDFKSCDNKQRHKSTNELRKLLYGEGICDTSSVPVNACAPSFDKKRFYVKGTTVDIQTDSLHELRPNRTLSNVSSTVIATHVCGMLNNRKGGHIIFGISKTSKVEGVKASRDDRDEFRLGVDKMMTDKLTPGALHSLFDMEYHPIMVENELTGELTPTQDLYVIIIQIKPSKGILYTLKTDNTSYIRFGPSTSPLSVQDLRNLVILEEEDRYRSQIMELRNRLR